jgi:phytoene dehydrogenase-like protein
MHYDVVIIGAGMSALAAGIRLAYFEKRVCIVERHYAWGGLNSYYTLDGRAYDVGLHAVTNYVPPGVRQTPLPRVLRQLRLTRKDFDLCEQRFSEIVFPACRLRFDNNPELLIEEVARWFPNDVDGLRRVFEIVRAYGYDPKETGKSAREFLAGHIKDPMLIEMILCPVMYYGSPTEHDLDFGCFAILFQSIFCEGFARPRDGVRRIIKALVKQFRTQGGKFKMNCGVERINADAGRVTSLTLDNGETITADLIFSSAGSHETMRLCSDAQQQATAGAPGRLSFVESISILEKAPADLGLDATIMFFNDADRFTYARPEGLIDLRSGVICCPNNYDRHEDLSEGIVRVTVLADYDRWARLSEEPYAAAKQDAYQRMVDRAARFMPGLQRHTVAKDVFTPKTIEKYTGHTGGTVYGAPKKHPDGTTHLENLFLCGTDQGLVGIMGALLSGIVMANRHGLGME